MAAKKTETLSEKGNTKQLDDKSAQLVFGKMNYIIMAIACAITALGFILMIGGESKDPKVFNEAIFNFQRLTLAPILILGGYVVAIFAIMKK